ncbi:MAG: EthD family reductase [Chloroflexi bacterium]|nr:EthD family reductase [Chloroflexota bacterium]
MYKLVILIEPQADWDAFDQRWPEFLRPCEQMPGLQRETTSRVDRLLHGRYHTGLIHELYFDSMDVLKAAMESPAGQEAGRALQRITEGQVTLLMAHHLEDEMSNIRAHGEADA